jgi:hypothetical protein
LSIARNIDLRYWGLSRLLVITAVVVVVLALLGQYK